MFITPKDKLSPGERQEYEKKLTDLGIKLKEMKLKMQEMKLQLNVYKAENKLLKSGNKSDPKLS